CRSSRRGPLAVRAAVDAGELGVEDEMDPLGEETSLEDLRRVGVLPIQDVAARVEDRYLRAETTESLSELASDGAGTDDRETPRALRQLEDVLVGEKARLGEAGDGRPMSATPGGDDRPLEAERRPVHAHRTRPREAAFAEEHVHPEPPKARRRVVRADTRADTAQALHDGTEVHLDGPGQADAESGRRAELPDHAR